MCHDLETWNDLLAALRGCTAEQLSRPIQFIPPSPCEEEQNALGVVIGIGTVREMMGEGIHTRSPDDNGYHPDDLVLSCDINQFFEDGTCCIDLETGERF